MATRNAPQPDTRDGHTRYPTIKVENFGQDGNAFALMGQVIRALRHAGVSSEEIALYQKESMSGDYDHLIQTAMRWVEV